ncbi:MAG TPA: hypothetical protein VF355_05940 [Anaerolineaceae bacterium]
MACLGVSLAYTMCGTAEFDEGFNLQVPTNLAQNGVYGTTPPAPG